MNQPKKAPKRKKILVYFLGGITYAEVAALRFLQNLYPPTPTEAGFKFIIATTSIINGETALKQLSGPDEHGLLLTELLK